MTASGLGSVQVVREVSAGYGELALVEMPAIDLLTSLGWSFKNLYAETFGELGSEGRESESQVILTRRLRAALVALNPGLPADAYAQAIEQLAQDRSKQIAVNANRDVYRLLKDGVKVKVPDEHGGHSTETLRVIDWATPANNQFFLASQMWVAGDMYRRRCDLLAFVNGLPLVFIELKKPSVPLKSAFDDNLRDYRGQSVPQLFHPNAFILLSNGSDTRVGTLTSGWEHFFDWKRVADEGETGKVSLERALRGLLEPARLLDYIEHFTVFEESKGGLIKKVAKNHQVLGVNKSIARLVELRETERLQRKRLGVFWHTQGSGKSLSMVFFTQKVLRKVLGSCTFVIVTDREELDDQISKTFKATGATAREDVRATSGEHLKELLRGNERYIFTLIQKFRNEPGQPYPMLSDRSDVIVITDEAHRSQYDLFALNMRNALPKAGFIGFTGTPLIKGEEERTREVFGDYVSVYDFARSIEDGATVPLYYENRIPEVQLTNQDLNHDLEALLEAAELDEAQEKKLEREFGREYHVITREDRLEAIAKDLVAHFTGRGYRGKAMMVCIDKATAVRMHDKVRAHWQTEITRLKALLEPAQGDAREALIARIHLMETTDMAVVVSQGQNEVEDLKAKGLDIVPHRQRMLKESLDEQFKEEKSDLRLVFVCAMWITGFDVPTCSTIYLDKPMRAHTLMQTIARANRVAPGKESGLIVDYVGIFRALQSALATYARPATGGAAEVGEEGGDVTCPILAKTELVAALHAALSEAAGFAQARGVDLDAIAQARGFARIGLIDDAVEAFLGSDADKKQFLQLAGRVARLFKAILPDAAANAVAPLSVLVSYLAAKIRAEIEPPDISTVMGDVEALLNDSIATEGYRIGPVSNPQALVNLSEIDFAALQAKFAQGHKRTEAEKLKRLIADKLAQMVAVNPSRMDLAEKFQKLIDAYNAGSQNIEVFFGELRNFTQLLSAEEQRGIAEGLNEEELALFDILTKPEPALTKAEEAEVKKVCKELLATLKREKLVLDWREKQQARAAVKLALRGSLSALPKGYTREIRGEKLLRAYSHIYDRYGAWGSWMSEPGRASF